jgi:hypothetical protein
LKKTEVILAYGHELIKATHKTTLEITKDKSLTERGNCIIAVGSNKSISDLSREFMDAVKQPKAEVTIKIEADGEKEYVTASGNSRVTYSHPTDIVIRKSSYICNRTLAVNADKAAADLSRRLINKLQKPIQPIHITLTAYVPE